MESLQHRSKPQITFEGLFVPSGEYWTVPWKTYPWHIHNSCNSQGIRQRLLEKKDFLLKAANEHAYSLERAQQQFPISSLDAYVADPHQYKDLSD